MKSKIFNPQDKIFYHSDRIMELFKTGNVAPILVEIDPSNICNHSCSFCLSSHIHKKSNSILSKEVLIPVIDELNVLGVKAINWTGGGDPTVNPELKEIIEYTKQNTDIKMGMFTNGTLLHKFDLYDTIVDSLEWIRISVDAGLENTYNSIRQTNRSNDWNTLLYNLSNLVEAKKKRKSPIDIGVGFIITKQNYTEIIQFAHEFSRFDITYCQFKPEIVNIEQGKSQLDKHFLANEIEPRLKEAEKILQDKYQINSYKLEDLLHEENYGRCYKKCLGSQVQPCIGADGNVYVCPNHRGHIQYSYGSILDRSFSFIWGDLANRQAIMSLIENKENFANCSVLCKPHEGNKAIWDLYTQYTKTGTIICDYNKEIQHPEFI